MANTGANFPVKTFDTTTDALITGNVAVHAITFSCSDAGHAVVTSIDHASEIVAELRVPANGFAAVELGNYTVQGGLQVTTLTGTNPRLCIYT